MRGRVRRNANRQGEAQAVHRVGREARRAGLFLLHRPPGRWEFLSLRTGNREYFDADQLEVMTGQPTDQFLAVVLKETVDNGLDAAEERRRAPQLAVRAWCRKRDFILQVDDNGGGIPPEVVESITNLRTL